MLPYTFYDYPRGDIDTLTKFAIFGIPWDANSTHMQGCARAAPLKLREITSHLARMTEKGHNIEEFAAADFGDVNIYPSLPDKSRSNIIEFVKEFLPWKSASLLPIMIGGDHYCTYPVVKALSEIYAEKSQEKIGVIIFDAHLDYYDKWLDVETDFHCTVTKRITDLPNIDPEHVAVIGIRDADIPEYELARTDGLYWVNAYELYPYDQLQNQIEKLITYYRAKNITKIYLSIDIDALDGAVAPGTGYTLPGGLSYRDLWLFLQKIIQNFTLIGMDLVEVAPDMDLPSKLTQITAVKLITETMAFITEKED
ncbi:N(1)-aminopropylagmatine ureohydrolase [Candidatus Lokiarchaeum ossiferum]|uniref:N(1)-aminopropylagmatine ureohydrolase n=1 Tax=Candidatus Lokiarchaeum ossiferum TaxID=2951803 RepID=A0ABY6HJZ5_9ARCH|nr:N(1)-aminopropylagmatine ureohydrolase [Candidatus Lokiarchaeum sp. B-35]